MTPQRCAIIDGKLLLEWQTSHVELDGTTLRSNCRCAECRFLTLTNDARTIYRSNAGEAITILAASPLGYGVQLHFSDGHNRGVFPWAYLADIGAGLR